MKKMTTILDAFLNSGIPSEILEGNENLTNYIKLSIVQQQVENERRELLNSFDVDELDILLQGLKKYCSVPEMVSVSEAAEILGKGTQLVRQYCREGHTLKLQK